MTTVTKKDLIDRVVQATEMARSDVRRVLQCFIDRVGVELVLGNRLELRDFGVFEVRERGARYAQNPKTMQRIHVPRRKMVKFKASRTLRDSLDNGRHGKTEVVIRRRRGATVKS